MKNCIYALGVRRQSHRWRAGDAARDGCSGGIAYIRRIIIVERPDESCDVRCRRKRGYDARETEVGIMCREKEMIKIRKKDRAAGATGKK